MARDTIIKSRLVFHAKEIEKDGGIIEMKAYEVTPSKKYPLGFRYSLYYVRNEKVLVGYDNRFPKGPHKHSDGCEHSYEFKGIDELIKDFLKDTNDCKKKIQNES